MFQIIDLSDCIASRPEALGTKEKFWLTPRSGGVLNDRPHLFKIGRDRTGENWSEKVGCEVARLIDLPCAEYNFAEYEGRKGVLTERFIPDTGTMFLGNIILSREVPYYDNSKTYDQIEYKLSTVVQVLKGLPLKPPISTASCAYGMDGIDYFIGYLIFDCLVGNTDRHHENWGVIINTMQGVENLHLAPSFDHASCLGRNELDSKRIFRLQTKDRRASVEAYAGRARSAFYGGLPGSGTLANRDLLPTGI